MDNVKSQRLQNGTKTLDIVYCAIGVALIAVCSWITVPMTVPFTLQTLAVFAVLLLLGGERGTIATLVYVLMGAIGIPVFAGFSGGLGILLGSTGGYIIGFIFIGLIYMVMTKVFGKKLHIEIIALVLGLIVCYAFGTGWFMYVYMKSSGPVGLLTVLSWCVFPFIIPDLAKMAVAVIISRRVRPYIK
ncbi:BioY family protein [Butyrivibrio proteoclasticus B316]|uniref:Biotin transporter n=1 Tax=Butyrivibrio proteoclasticus (strain ATCC 51982 / DSM 14932 / B316) TaxID=515622 RepID=E0S3C5_BUTPB|nr:biotin transporter BioY [Butyrivibrio proteoclasticus]ADL35907.1 BioY family protein [Butyrivibrio proteoclasticus B316]